MVLYFGIPYFRGAQSGMTHYGNEPEDFLKGNHRGWMGMVEKGVIPSFPAEKTESFRFRISSLLPPTN